MITYFLERPILVLFMVYVPLTWLITMGAFTFLLWLGGAQ